jgi:dihydrofolate reductase
MRKVTFGGAISLDNYLARSDDTVDWLMWNKEVTAIISGFWKTIDTVLMGRRTYEVGLRMGGVAYPNVTTYVFSRTLKSAGDGIEIVAEDAPGFVRRLKRKKGKGICVMGGGVLAHTLFEAGLIDEVDFNIHPVLLGSGIPLFYKTNRQINLELLKCQELKNGCVVVTYRVKHRVKK